MMYSRVRCLHLSHCCIFLRWICTYWILELQFYYSNKTVLFCFFSTCDVWQIVGTWQQQHESWPATAYRVHIIQCIHCVVRDRNLSGGIVIDAKKKKKIEGKNEIMESGRRWSNRRALVPGRARSSVGPIRALSASHQPTISDNNSNFPDHPTLSGRDKWTGRGSTVPIAQRPPTQCSCVPGAGATATTTASKSSLSIKQTKGRLHITGSVSQSTTVH